MRRLQITRWSRPSSRTNSTSSISKLPIIQIQNATFYRRYPSPKEEIPSLNPPLFSNLTFSLPSFTLDPQNWAIVGGSSTGKTTFLEILRGEHICIPPASRAFPFLSSLDDQKQNAGYRSPSRAIHYVGFTGEGGGKERLGTRGSYLSARYESHREESDITVLNYLLGNTELNPLYREEIERKNDDRNDFDKVVEDLRLGPFIHMSLGNLSNGQTRRARIAKALLGKPEILLLDQPFMGLDPPTLTSLSTLLHKLTQTSSPRLVLALRPQDHLPDWITHLVFLNSNLQIAYQGPKGSVSDRLVTSKPRYNKINQGFLRNEGNLKTEVKMLTNASGYYSREKETELSSLGRDGVPVADQAESNTTNENEILVEMKNIQIRYGEKQILGGWTESLGDRVRKGLWWTVRRGERWGVFGPNGSGKTTILSLICSDHPQSYSLPIKIFGRERLPKLGQLGISVFDIQARIGQSSPEIHAFFPRNLTIRQTIRNAWADTFLGTPRLTREAEETVESHLRWFESELNLSMFSSMSSNLKKDLPCPGRSTSWADMVRFGDVPFSSQRVMLLLRAIVKKPDLIILDEAFSGMDEFVRDKCMLFLAWGETRSLNPSKSQPLAIGKTGHLNDPYDLDKIQARRLTGLTDEQALICVSHLKDEVPSVVRNWLCLPEPKKGEAARFGRFDGPLEDNECGWNEIWRI